MHRSLGDEYLLRSVHGPRRAPGFEPFPALHLNKGQDVAIATDKIHFPAPWRDKIPIKQPVTVPNRDIAPRKQLTEFPEFHGRQRLGAARSRLG